MILSKSFKSMSVRYTPVFPGIVFIAFLVFCISLITLCNRVEASAPGDTDFLEKAESYLNTLRKVQAPFIMTTPEGGSVTGTFYLKKPGKLRFEYDDPIKDFIVADGTFIYFYDAELGSQSHAFIGQTLADFVVRDNIDLSEDVKIVDVINESNKSYIILTQEEDPAAGALTLEFSKEPFRLKSWEVLDSAGNITKVRLGRIRTDVTLENDLFYYSDPQPDQFQYNE